jgi:hypothetical protein
MTARMMAAKPRSAVMRMMVPLCLTVCRTLGDEGSPWINYFIRPYANLVVTAARMVLTPLVNGLLGNQDNMLSRAGELSLPVFRRMYHPHPLAPLNGDFDIEGDTSILHTALAPA